MLKKSVLTLLAVFALAQPAAAADTPVATVTATKGVVLLHQTGRSAPTSLNKGDKLFAGDEITTEHNGSATFEFAKDGSVALGKGSEMQVSVPGGKTNVKIVRGAFAATGKAVPAIESPCGAVAVKEGRVVSAQKDGACAFYMTEGTATVKNSAGLTVLTAGQGTNIKGHAAAEAPSTWNEEQVSWMRGQLPADTLPSLAVAPQPAPAPAAVAPATVDAAPVAPVEATPVPAEAAPAPAVVTPEPAPALVPDAALAPVVPEAVVPAQPEAQPDALPETLPAAPVVEDVTAAPAEKTYPSDMPLPELPALPAPVPMPVDPNAPPLSAEPPPAE